jgi:hypothetical protein
LTLWPQSYITQPLNAHVKDELENKLHELICSGQLPVEKAQQEISQDWIAAYQKHIGPIPEGAQTPHTASSATVDQPDQAGNCPLSSPIKVSNVEFIIRWATPVINVRRPRTVFPR